MAATAYLPAVRPVDPGNTLMEKWLAKGRPMKVMRCGHYMLAVARISTDRLCPPCEERAALERAARLAKRLPALLPPAPTPADCPTCRAQREAGPYGALAIRSGAPHRPRIASHPPHCDCSRCWYQGD